MLFFLRFASARVAAPRELMPTAAASSSSPSSLLLFAAWRADAMLLRVPLLTSFVRRLPPFCLACTCCGACGGCFCLLLLPLGGLTTPLDVRLLRRLVKPEAAATVVAALVAVGVVAFALPLAVAVAFTVGVAVAVPGGGTALLLLLRCPPRAAAVRPEVFSLGLAAAAPVQQQQTQITCY